MASKNKKLKTVADIVAEKRELAKKMRLGNPSLDEIEMAVNLEYDANRIEALWKREKAEIEVLALSEGGMVEASRHKQGYNAAAMREALEAARDLLLPQCNGGTAFAKACGETVNKIMDALAKPPRNCDFYDNKTDAETRFVEETGENDMAQHYWQMFAIWLLAPAADRKGEGDGK